MPCAICGIEGFHACPGRKIPPMTDEEKARFDAALAEMIEGMNSRTVPPDADGID